MKFFCTSSILFGNAFTDPPSQQENPKSEGHGSNRAWSVQYLKGGYGAVEMGQMMAMLVLAIIPIIIFYLACQKYIIAGVVAGAVKG